jgi:hypothetical protein
VWSPGMSARRALAGGQSVLALGRAGHDLTEAGTERLSVA